MHRSLRLSALLLAVSADEICLDEQSSLMQEAGPVKTNKRVSSKPLTGLLESARGFLTNGVTPDVVTFAQQTLDEVSNTIIPTLEDEATADQTWLTTERARFDTALAELVTSNTVVHQWNTEEVAASTAHQTCRGEQKTDCDEKRVCEMDLYHLWGLWVTAETELREDHAQIENHFCVQDANGNYIANGTLHVFRVQSVPYMESYLLQKMACDTAETNYDNYVPTCNTKHNDLNSKSLQCNGHQTTLEGKACSHASAAYSTLRAFHSTWAALHASYQGISDLVYNQTQDRHQEYRTLTIVQCLLRRVNEFNGRPCDESTGSVDDQMTHCESEGSDITICTDRPVLCPNFDPPPPTPDPCTERNSVGSCLPVPMPFCVDSDLEDAWFVAEMQMGEDYPTPFPLPLVPQAPFSATNPGCNAYPDCTACDPGSLPWTGYPTWIEPPASFAHEFQTFNEAAVAYSNRNMLNEGDGPWLQGATIDGCQSDNSNSHDYEGDQTGQAIPFLMRSSPDDTAAVRCCSWGDLTCSSQVGGVCYDSATFSQAQSICADAGQRLCSQAEVQDGRCCGTGCWFNHFAVWISDGWITTSSYDNPTQQLD